jgi:hypothetical protein
MEDRKFIAFEIYPNGSAGMKLEPATYQRQWMDETRERFAYRCLPLTIANQYGWVVTCPASFGATWTGGDGKEHIHFQWAGNGWPDNRITSHFGSGVLTFSIPFLFRTPRGINLWVRGPTNMVKDGIGPLDGIVESDWSVATFTMNWKFTRPNHTVYFAEGEPICMVVPIQRGLIDVMEPTIELLDSRPDLKEQFEAWSRDRSGFIKQLKDRDEEAVKQGWQKDYFKGKAADGSKVEEHQTKVNLKPFRRV